ncbi:MAG: response regulator [Deltaproteobacteria bacterium]|jgi:CheY-like chemotaxis protein
MVAAPGKVFSAMIVDDSDADVYLASHFLQRSGRFEHVWGITEPEDALALFEHFEETAANDERFPPSLILLDINMPRMNGFEFLEALQKLELARKPVVVIVSSSDHENDRTRAAQSPLVREYVTKPLSKAVAAELADRLLDD